MTTLAIFGAVELEIGEFPQLLLPQSLLILCKLHLGLRAKICPVCCNTTSSMGNSCSRCHRGGRNLCRLAVWWGWRSRACCSYLARSAGSGFRNTEQGSSLVVVSGLVEERVIIEKGWETHMGMGIIFFHIFSKSLWLFWFTGGGNKTACLKGLWHKHPQARFSPALKAVKVIELNWCHQPGSVPYTGIRVHTQSWRLVTFAICSVCFSLLPRTEAVCHLPHSLVLTFQCSHFTNTPRKLVTAHLPIPCLDLLAEQFCPLLSMAALRL